MNDWKKRRMTIRVSHDDGANQGLINDAIASVGKQADAANLAVVVSPPPHPQIFTGQLSGDGPIDEMANNQLLMQQQLIAQQYGLSGPQANLIPPNATVGGMPGGILKVATPVATDGTLTPVAGGATLTTETPLAPTP